MSYSNSFNIGADNLVLGSATGTVNISSLGGEDILINGVSPGGGGASLPLIGTGNITVQGNIKAQGDGVNTGLLEGAIIKATTGDIIVTQGKVAVLAGNVEISGTGNLEINGTGEIKTEGGGNITAGLSGDIQTTTGDIISGNDIYFEGQDIYHRTNNPVANLSYKDYKQLPGKNDNNVFTGSNQFNSNTTEFAAKVSVGTRDGGGLYTQNLALNVSGNIECKTLNNTTQIQCGNINCGNGGDNEVRARVFNTRTNEHNSPDGWLIEQALPNSPAQQVDKVLQMKAQEAGGYITITPTDFTGTDPAIILDPNTTANGGKIYAASFTFGTTADRFDLIQDLTGPQNHTLQISAPTASSKVEFSDNNNNVILDVNKTEINLGNTIPINFGLYSFRPQQYIFNFTGATIDDSPPAVLFRSNVSLWRDVNNPSASTQTLHQIGEGYFKMTILGGASNGGTYGGFRFMCDFPFMIPNFSPAVPVRHIDGAYIGSDYPSGSVYPRLCGFSGTSTDYKLCWINVPTGTETYDGIITITKMDY